MPIAQAGGRKITADVLAVSDSKSGAVVASYRNYMFFSKWSFLFALGTGSPNASVSCADPNQVARDVKWFNTNVLSEDVPAVHIP